MAAWLGAAGHALDRRRPVHRHGRLGLIPDKADEGPKAVGTLGAFLATVVAFFLVEIGDKTQIATVALAARFQNVFAVTAGTTRRHDAGQRAGACCSATC